MKDLGALLRSLTWEDSHIVLEDWNPIVEQTSMLRVESHSNCSPELLHVDDRDTCCDQEGWIKRSESENIQSNLKGGFLGLEYGAQSVVTTANRTLRIRVLHHIANSDCEGLLRIQALKDIANSETIGFIANSYAKDYLRIRVLHETTNSESMQAANSWTTESCKFVHN
ncbi:hypothetical protein Tco_0835556 [Tanacetum coccineum]